MNGFVLAAAGVDGSVEAAEDVDGKDGAAIGAGGINVAAEDVDGSPLAALESDGVVEAAGGVDGGRSAVVSVMRGGQGWLRGCILVHL